MSQNVIELNGKRYDATTGAYLGKSHIIPKHITDQYIRGKVVDGFIRPMRHTPKSEPPKAAHGQSAADKKPAAHGAKEHQHAAATHLKAHRPEHAKTLMHRAGRKPEFSLKPIIKTQAPAEIIAKPKSAIMYKPSAYGVDPSRHQRASLVNRHHAVRHFHAGGSTPAIHAVSMQVQPIAVRPVPLSVAAQQPTHNHTDIFEAAIANATSHTQPAHKARRHKTKRRRILNSLAIVGAFLVLAGFVGYLNLPQLEVRVASIQAGFGVSMPGYAPTGYALEDGVKRSGGTVSLSFRSGDSRYIITQQSSNWNSQTLLDNTLALNGDHQTVQKNGQTIYIYNDNGTNAAWVNGGVRYDIIGNAQLSKDDITAIAASL